MPPSQTILDSDVRLLKENVDTILARYAGVTRDFRIAYEEPLADRALSFMVDPHVLLALCERWDENNISAEEAKALDAKIAGLEKDVEDLQERLDDAECETVELERDLEGAEQKITKLEAEIEELNEELSDISRSFDEDEATT